MNKGILISLLIVIILASGCLSEKEYTGDELTDIALADPGVADILDGYEYAIIDYGPAERYPSIREENSRSLIWCL
ncbi:hypothetical protein Mpet_0249 [Methanolacinia petrolearia DSM 11571]|uniref:Uncharacterized protein n=1 Tax=Methanolacinia petrolearia (strain DSM 11571 / OCM 486 / SEBR 4847) TaxID=679926 RepID=E1RF79_METP4|nr:hypothetical protein [Methanolacinia petrolearia]ADN35027.1 hypothetical protein Mpet_0249 [Methanolacinia petrolearia DSM 11571]